MEDGLEDVRAHLTFSAGYRRLLSRLDPFVLGRRGTYLTFESRTFRPDAFVLDLLGVSAAIAPPGSPAPAGDLRLAYRGPDGDVYERPWRAPARLVPRGGDGLESRGRVTSFAGLRTRWVLEVDADDGATLLLGRSRLGLVDRVLVDGARAPSREDVRAEGLLAVDVPAGRHSVEVDAALPARLGALSAAGLIALLAAVLASLRAVRLRSA